MGKRQRWRVRCEESGQSLGVAQEVCTVPPNVKKLFRVQRLRGLARIDYLYRARISSGIVYSYKQLSKKLSPNGFKEKANGYDKG